MPLELVGLAAVGLWMMVVVAYWRGRRQQRVRKD